MEKLFIPVYHYFEKHRTLFFLLLTACFLLVAVFAVRIHFEEDISKVLPKDKKIEKLNEVFQNSRFTDKLALTISLEDSTASDPDRLVAYADEFIERISVELKPFIRTIHGRVDDERILEMVQRIREHLPVFLEEKDYLEMDSLIHSRQVKKSLEHDYRTLASPSGFVMKDMIANDPVGITSLGLKKLQRLQVEDHYELYNNYIFTKDHKHLLIFLTPLFSPTNTGDNSIMLHKLDSAIALKDRQGKEPVRVSYFGATAVSVGNAMQLRQDILFTQGITALFLILFIGFYFRKIRAPVVILLPVLFGALFSLAVIYFLKGSISVIALGTGSVVFGIAVNYSLHIFNHYKHTNDVRRVIRDLSMPMTVGSFTTIGGFLCLQFVKSEMLRDLGLFTAFSLIGSSLFSLIFLPHLMGSKKDPVRSGVSRVAFFEGLSRFRMKYSKFLVVLIFILSIFFFYASKKVGFESDMMRMNFMSEKLKGAEEEMNRINAFALQSVYLVTEGRTTDAALVNNEKLSAGIDELMEAGVVKKYSGVNSILISDSLQQSRIRKWNNYWTPEKKLTLLSAIRKESAALKFNPTAFAGFSLLLNTDFKVMDRQELADIRKDFLEDFITENPGNTTVVSVIQVQRGEKQKVYDKFESDPTITVVDKQYLTNKFVGLINSDFMSIAIMTSILVFTVLLLTYGRIELALVSFIPMFISWVWILGIMGIFDIRFNIINIIISALIFGLGDDYSLFIMDGLLQEYKTGKKNLSSYTSSILLSAVTTVAGLGVLIFAKHPALRSIAAISIIGMSTVVFISLVLIPFLFNFLIRNRTEKKKFPWTLFSLLKSAFAFSYFVFGCLLLCIVGIFFVKLKPFGRERGKFIYHVILCRFAWSLMYIMANVKKVVINKTGEKFMTPAVIISNHQSFLDILSTIMLHPKLVIMTNDWVWNSPFFGFVVRMADYYPIAHGVEYSVDKLAERVREGYSVIVFPEGTRSVDGTIARFHKGAFFLAEKLKLDILPILIHGTGYTMSKNDFFLKDGQITLELLPRISPDNTSFGTDYSLRAKKIGRYFRQEYNRLKVEIEKPHYYRQQLISNFLYKGPVLEWYMKLKIRMEKHYKVFDELLPREGKILDIGCGYGFMDYLLHFASPGREFSGIDYDEEKIETANHCFGKTGYLKFQHADAIQFAFSRYNAVILADVLHYLRAEEQVRLIEQCIHSLLPGGKIIVRDGNKELEKRHKRTRLTEYFSTRLIGFNKTTDAGLSYLSSTTIRQIASEQDLDYSEIDNTKHTSNLIYVLSMKPISADAWTKSTDQEQSEKKQEETTNDKLFL